MTKERYLSLTQESFQDTEVNITTEGRPLLGAAIGKISFVLEYVTQKVQTWVKELERLSSIAESQPHAAYASLTHGLSSKWSYLSRTVPNISHLLQPLEDTLKSKLIPQLTGKEPPNDLERDLLALPARLGGMGICNPVLKMLKMLKMLSKCSVSAQNEFQASKDITKSLSDQISQQNANYSFEVLEKQLSAKARVKSQRRLSLKAKADNLRESLPSSLQLAMDLSKEKGASNWLTVLPIEEHGFTLHKRAIRDAICLRYGWLPAHVPVNCACGSSFSVQHVLSCPKGGYPSIRHNEIRDLTANLLTETCHGVAIEPTLQSVSSEQLNGATANSQVGARLDIVANGFWGDTFERAFFDVRVSNPFAPSNRHPRISSVYRKHENLKSVTTNRESGKLNIPPSHPSFFC